MRIVSSLHCQRVISLVHVSKYTIACQFVLREQDFRDIGHAMFWIGVISFGQIFPVNFHSQTFQDVGSCLQDMAIFCVSKSKNMKTIAPGLYEPTLSVAVQFASAILLQTYLMDKFFKQPIVTLLNQSAALTFVRVECEMRSSEQHSSDLNYQSLGDVFIGCRHVGLHAFARLLNNMQKHGGEVWCGRTVLSLEHVRNEKIVSHPVSVSDLRNAHVDECIQANQPTRSRHTLQACGKPSIKELSTGIPWAYLQIPENE